MLLGMSHAEPGREGRDFAEAILESESWRMKNSLVSLKGRTFSIEGSSCTAIKSYGKAGFCF